jgi:hypothetical protein
MPAAFTHPFFQVLSFTEVPHNQEVWLMDKKWMPSWERSWLNQFSGSDTENVGYVSPAVVRNTSKDALELSWYPNTLDRFHEVPVVLPRSAFIVCVEVRGYDDKPRVFVESEWLSDIHLRPYSAFAMIDAIGVKVALLSGALTAEKLLQLRDRIDDISSRTPNMAFVSFADTLLVKANWHVGQYDSAIKYSYEPEAIIRVIPEIAVAYRDVLDMDIYAVLTQGVNEYVDTSLLHVSPSKNHVSLNSLGLPFAQLLAIDDAARTAIRTKQHEPFELYVDDLFYNSLRFTLEFDKRAKTNAPYKRPMSTAAGKYYCLSVKALLDGVDRAP